MQRLCQHLADQGCCLVDRQMVCVENEIIEILIIPPDAVTTLEVIIMKSIAGFHLRLGALEADFFPAGDALDPH